MRLIDADNLFKEIKRNDLEYMQQGDIIECLKDIIEKQTTVSSSTEANKLLSIETK